MKAIKILALGAHPDDIDGGCGATLAMLKRKEGADIDIMVFSDCADEVPEGWPLVTLNQEARNAARVLGVEEIKVGGFTNKALEMQRQEVLELLYRVREEDYDMVFTHSSFTSNQDHATLYNESKRAFRGTTILGYTTPSSDYGFAANPVFMVVQPEDIDVKVAMLACYKSQFELNRPYIDEVYTRGLLQANGVECWQRFAERFELIRMVMR